MKGDFSGWRFRALDNFNAVLHQQGRVLNDVDFTAAERIDLHWQHTAGRDVIGARVAAVPAGEPNGFRIVSARVDNTGGTQTVLLEVSPGRAWADGLLTYLAGATEGSTAAVTRAASYFSPPVQSPAATPASIGDDIRDAVILELTQEEVNAFQWPERLLEPALGDLDTTERVQTSFAFRLYRLAANETCRSIIAGLQDGPAGKGRLTVTLEPAADVVGECPVPAGGGYTGFEHNLYRLEIAHTPPAVGRHFKWSQFNGGLVGRGRFHAATRRCEIRANRAAILTSNLTSFYLEAVRFDAAIGRWTVDFGAIATLNAQNELALTDPPFFGTFPAADEDVFFRLWNGIEPIASFTNAANPPLLDGIELLFDAPTATNYRPGDYWTFPVRVGQATTQPLVDNEPPHGVFHHRVALAEIHWTDRRNTAVSGTIADCRRRFRPLTNQNVCCTFLVGDGVNTFGDFNSLEEAAAHLPSAGGELCLLPGIHHSNLSLTGRQKITIHGCPKRSIVLPRVATKSSPILEFIDCEEIQLRGLDLVSFDGLPIYARSTAGEPPRMRDLSIEDCRILGCHENTIRIDRARDIHIARNVIWQLDKLEAGAAISFEADGVLIERNRLGVVPAGTEPAPPGAPESPEGENPSDPCAESDLFYAVPFYVVAYASGIWSLLYLQVAVNPYRALGGIHVRAGSEQVRIADNRIMGGASNGITLGGELIARDRPREEPGPPDRRRETLTLTTGRFLAVVRDASGNVVPNVELTLTNAATGATRADLSDSVGQASITGLAPGQYQLTVQPGYRVLAVVQAAEGDTFAITVGNAAVPAAETTRLAQIYRVEIVENDITLMGLSGVGFGVHPPVSIPRPGLDLEDLEPANPGIPVTIDLNAAILGLIAPDDLLSVANGVNELQIRNNRIHRNLLSPFTAQMREQAARVGRGGISLAICSELVIAENHIVDNGPTAADPVCGIFIGYAEDVDIGDNVIANNGALPDGPVDLREGIRGGIAIRLAAAGGLDTAEIRKPALRVHDNRIDQPAGRALAAIAFGPVMCADNFLNSERVGRATFLDLLVGGVMIINFAGLHHYLRNVLGSGRFENVEVILPGGETILANNHVRLGPQNVGLSSLGVLTIDDLGADGNQSTVFQRRLLLANSLLWALTTVRVTNNRLSEMAPEPTWSLWSAGFASNVTAINQADHCIITQGAAGAASITIPNVILRPSACGRFAESAAQWQYIITVLLQALGGTPSPGGTTATPNPKFVDVQVGNAYEVYTRGQSTKRYVMHAERQRVAAKYGADSPRVQVLERQLQVSRVVSAEMRNLAETARAPVVVAPERGAVFTGRVVDTRSRGQAEVVVALVRADGRALDLTARTDRSGNFAVPVDAVRAERLAKEGPVFVRVLDEKGTALMTSKEPVAFAATGQIVTELTVPSRVIPPSVFTGGRPIFDVRDAVTERESSRSTESTGSAPSPPVEPVAPEPGRPAEPAQPVQPPQPPKPTSTPLTDVRGLGRARIATLNRAGIVDVEGLLQSNLEQTARLVGIAPATLKKNAEEALKKS